jgi:hypothetical protein
MANTTSELGAEKQSSSSNPASMLAALVLGLNRRSRRPAMPAAKPRTTWPGMPEGISRPRQDHGKTTECHALAKYQGIAGLTLVSASITFMNWSQPGEWHRGTGQKPIHKSK